MLGSLTSSFALAFALAAIACSSVTDDGGLAGKSDGYVLPGLDVRPTNATCLATVPPAASLSQTGCVAATDPSQPADGLIPFGVNAELWSDGATKTRHLALPDHEQIEILADGDFDLPPGTVLMKQFSIAGQLVETRLLIRAAQDGTWSGFSYEWNPDGRDATLLSAGKTTILPNGQRWRFPGAGECRRCHTDSAGHALGPELGQLNRSFYYAATDRTANQISTWAHLGLFSNPPELPPEQLPRLSDPRDATAPVAQRARSYLHGNCAHCHRADYDGGCPGDLRFGTPLAEMNICNVPPPLGGFGFPGNLLTPGDPSQSVIHVLMSQREFGRMPPLATYVVDHAAIDTVGEWIQTMTSCD